jgi:hypothetical protein
MKNTLSPAWDRWRRRRVKEFINGGMPKDSATTVAMQEALGRSRIARDTGYAAAAAASLKVVPGSDGRERLVLVLDPRHIPEHLRESAEHHLNPDVAMVM